MKHRRSGLFALVAGVLVLVVGSCSSILEPRTDPTRFFTLTPLSETRTAPDAAEQITLALGPVTFPDYLKRRDMVIRASANELQLHPYERWAAPLAENFLHVLSENLSTLLGTIVVAYPWYGDTQVDYVVEVDVLRFEADTAGNTTLIARWSVKDGADQRLLITKQSTLTGSAGTDGTAGTVAALNQSLGELSRRIVTTVGELAA